MALLVSLDQSSPAQLAQALAALPVDECVAWLRVIKSRHPQIDWNAAIAACSTSETLKGEMLRAGLLFSCGMHQNAVAAQFSQALLFNPLSSGVKALVFDAYITGAAGAELELWIANADVGTFAGGQGTNRNAAATAAPTKMTVRIGTNAVVQNGGGGRLMRLTTADLNPKHFNGEGGDQPFVELPPGFGLLIADIIVNDTINCGFVWAEVPANAAV